MAKTITFTLVPDQMVTDYVTRFGTPAAALAYLKKLMTDDYNHWKDQQADTAAIAARVAPSQTDPATITAAVV